MTPTTAPLPVAEMDFDLAPPIRDVLAEAVARSDTGYAGGARVGHFGLLASIAAFDDGRDRLDALLATLDARRGWVRLNFATSAEILDGAVARIEAVSA